MTSGRSRVDLGAASHPGAPASSWVPGAWNLHEAGRSREVLGVLPQADCPGSEGAGPAPARVCTEVGSKAMGAPVAAQTRRGASPSPGRVVWLGKGRCGSQGSPIPVGACSEDCVPGSQGVETSNRLRPQREQTEARVRAAECDTRRCPGCGGGLSQSQSRGGNSPAPNPSVCIALPPLSSSPPLLSLS